MRLPRGQCNWSLGWLVASGVGTATTNAVVSSSVLILAANYMITTAFFAV